MAADQEPVQVTSAGVALDQAGAVAGPLLVAAVAALAGTLWPAMAVLIVPGAAALFVLAWIRRRMPDPSRRT